MWAVHQRLAELWLIQKQRELTVEEQTEMVQCLEANLSKAWQMSKLINLSLVASMSNDVEWHMEICHEIDKVNFETGLI